MEYAWEARGGASGPRVRSGGTSDVRGGAGLLLGRSLESPTLLGRSLAHCAGTVRR
jgi:hypothetical protein